MSVCNTVVIIGTGGTARGATRQVTSIYYKSTDTDYILRGVCTCAYIHREAGGIRQESPPLNCFPPIAKHCCAIQQLLTDLDLAEQYVQVVWFMVQSVYIHTYMHAYMHIRTYMHTHTYIGWRAGGKGAEGTVRCGQ